MNAKYALALILTLQVSMTLCDIPAPSQDLINLYDGHRETMSNRLLNLANKIQAFLNPLVEKYAESGPGKSAKEYIDLVQAKPEFKAFVKIASDLGQEAAPIVEKVRHKVLGAYEHYLRPTIGIYAAEFVNNAKVHLDKFLPAQ